MTLKVSLAKFMQLALAKLYIYIYIRTTSVEEFISNRIDRIVRDMEVIRQPMTVEYIVKASVLIKNEKEFFFFFFFTWIVRVFDSFPSI